jgi:hypothetical protein
VGELLGPRRLGPDPRGGHLVARDEGHAPKAGRRAPDGRGLGRRRRFTEGATKNPLTLLPVTGCTTRTERSWDPLGRVARRTH